VIYLNSIIIDLVVSRLNMYYIYGVAEHWINLRFILYKIRKIR